MSATLTHYEMKEKEHQQQRGSYVDPDRYKPGHRDYQPEMLCHTGDGHARGTRVKRAVTCPACLSALGVPGALVAQIKAAGFTHVVTGGGAIPLEEWRPYGKAPEDVKTIRFRLEGDTIREEPVDAARATVGGVLMTGLWRLARIERDHECHESNDDGACVGCGVQLEGPPCAECGEVAFHAPACPVLCKAEQVAALTAEWQRRADLPGSEDRATKRAQYDALVAEGIAERQVCPVVIAGKPWGSNAYYRLAHRVEDREPLLEGFGAVGGPVEYQEGEPVEVLFPDGWRDGTFLGFVAGGVDEDFQRLDVRLAEPGHVARACHPDCVRRPLPQELETLMRYRCNRCRRPLRALTCGEDGGACGACECGGLIEADPQNFAILSKAGR
jgi:hypothetical protein